MKTKDLNRLLIIILLFSFVFFVTTVFVSNKSFSKESSFETALLNPKYKNDVFSILIEDEDGNAITIERKDSFYIASKNEISAAADKKITESAIENFSRLRKVYKSVKKNIQESKADFVENKESVHKNTQINNKGNTISFYNKSGEVLSSLTFYSADNLLNRITFETEGKNHIKNLYETDNDLSQFLKADFNYWAEGELFSEVKDPVKITYTLFNENGSALSSLTEITDSDTGFNTKAAAILKLRHGNIIEGKNAQGLDDKKLYSRLTVEDGKGQVLYIDFIENGSSYLCIKRIKEMPAALGGRKEAFLPLNAVFEISGWTVRNLEESVF